MKATLGSDRIGAGEKMTVDMHGWGKSNHNLNTRLRTSMSCGTLVPFYTKIALPGSSIDIDISLEALTLPTIGPLFGRYKVEAHMFATPTRLYQGDLITNKLDIGMEMQNVKFPKIKLTANGVVTEETKSGEQINPSCVLAYNGMVGLGRSTSGEGEVERIFMGGNYCAQLDIYKNYYANKQLGYGMFINNTTVTEDYVTTTAVISNSGNDYNILDEEVSINLSTGNTLLNIVFGTWNAGDEPSLTGIQIIEGGVANVNVLDMFHTWNWSPLLKTWTGSNINPSYEINSSWEFPTQTVSTGTGGGAHDGKPVLDTFELSNIDKMRRDMIMNNADGAEYIINESTLDLKPYNTLNQKGQADDSYTKKSNQQGLLIKCYDNDLLNNWLDKESIDGANGINELTKIDTSGGGFTIDAFITQRKIYDILNRRNIAGRDYKGYLKTSYGTETYTQINEPMYIGGLIKEIGFQEVISNAAASDNEAVQPLGTLAGRGVLSDKHKGGSVKARFSEAMYITGFVSITPIIDYSQGNDWEVNLDNYNDLHQPGLDQLGFQDLITDQMLWADTEINPNTGAVTFKAAGKQTAWQNYRTDISRVRGNFADGENQDYMTLLRRYEFDEDGMKDLTTYIDPTKFNHIFADGRLDAQNFWVHIGVRNTSRLVMSTREVPNL